jgi:peptidyl-prolyl cis-trans isomerase SurA
MPRGPLYSFADRQLTTREFAAFIERRRAVDAKEDPVDFIIRTSETLASKDIIDYENSILEKKYPDFRYLINEFYDGILLFEISADKIWNKIGADSSGLLKYYQENKNDYLSPGGISAKMYTFKDPGGRSRLDKAFRKYSGKKDGDSRMLARFNKNGDTLICVNEGKWYEGGELGSDILAMPEGLHRIVIGGYPAIIVIKGRIKPETLPFKEVREELMTGYQDYLESEWTKQLKAKYNVKVDNVVLDEIRKSLADK